MSSESIPTIDHNYVDGTCTECGEADGTGDAVTETETLTYVFSDYTAGTQYAENEEHILDENTTVTTTQAHFTSELRLYSSSTYNGYAIIQSVNPITAIVVNAGNKVDTLNVYACNDGNTWVLVGTISVTSTSYNNYTLDLGGAYNYVKLDVAGSNQVRIKSMSLTVEKAVDDDCSHTNTTTTTIDATCTVAGSITVTCDDCSIVISTTPISATGHQNTTTTTIDATCTVEGSITVTCNDCGATVSSESIPTIDHNYVDGTCSECGEEQTATPSETTVGITIADYADSNNWVNGQKYNSIEFDSNITVTASGTSNTGSYYTSGENWRIYQSDSGTITFNASNGCKISSITITYTSSNTGTLVFNGANVSSGTEITVNSETATFSMGNTGSASNGQARITAIDVVYTQPDACEHTNTTTTTIDATCTVAGSITVTCDDCSEVVSESEIPALGHNYVSGVCTRCDSVLPVATFNVPLGASSVTSILGPSVTLPAAPTLPGVPLDYAYEFVGWALEAQNGATVAPTLYAPNSVIEIDENTVFYAVYSYTDTVTTQINGYIEKDINEIQSTDVVVITVTTESGTVYAMSNDKGTSAAPTAVTITVNGNAIVGDVAANLLWNISNSGGNLTIYPDGTTATWLYCTSTNNGVRVGTNANKVFTIDSSTGYLKNTATSRYIGVYTTNPDWRCYTNTTGNTANQTLRFFVKTNSSVTTETVCYTTTLEFSSGFTGASLNVGEDLSVRYHALIDENPEAYTVRFTMNGEEIIVSGVEENGKYVFSFCGIAPQCMGDVIKAELLLGGEVIDTIEEYSVKQYVLDAIEYYPTDTHLHQLLHDMLVYGAMAQKYRGYKKDTLVTDGVAGLTPSALTPSQSDNAFAGNNAPDADTTLVKFISAGVRFDYDNKIFVKITTTESISNITIRVGGEALEIIDLGDDKYVAYSDRISALDFDESVLFELLYDGQLVQTLTYSVNTYAYNKQADAEIGDLVLALYRYGKSAEAYSLSKE